MTLPPPDAVFKLNAEVVAKTPAPEQLRAQEDDYECDPGYETFPTEIAQEGGPDGAICLMVAMWEGPTRGPYEELPDRHGYFIAHYAEGPWRWVLWRCGWDDGNSVWYWTDDVATDWATDDAAASGEALIRRVWAHWVAHGHGDRPVDYEGWMIDTGTVYDMVAEVFGEASVEEADVDAGSGTASPLTERFIADLAAYGATNDPSLIGSLRVLYGEWVQETSEELRLVTLHQVISQVMAGHTSSNVLLPFIGCEPDGMIASTAALSFALAHPTEADEAMLGVVLLARGMGTMANPGAVFGGLLNVGDDRVNKVLWPMRDYFSGADLDEVVRVRTGRLSAAVIGFLLEWIEQMPAEQRMDRFNPLAAGLVNQRVTAEVPLVALGGRVWPVAEATPEEEDAAALYVPLADYAQSIMGRLEALRAIAPEPDVVDYVIEAWTAEFEDGER